ncbi:hypothetical protein AB0O22_17700 [Streptomyces sp. NPDC091204]|uniref:hypothetical protein n=1 Tax=Streptomyces sp. NPDC091204 TaxID=3155299 RepID=UPI00343D1F10
MSERPEFDLAATIVRGQAPARAVTVQRAVAFSGRLTHQLDYVVYLHVLFAINSGAQVTVPGIVASVREAGVRSAKSGTELVGRDAIYESFARLIEARFIRRTTVPNPRGRGYRGLTSYEVYEHFEDNPDYSPEGPEAQEGTKLPVFAETAVSAGQPTSGVRGKMASSGVRGSRALSAVRGSGGAYVSAGQKAVSANTGNKGAPPQTPPEEVTTSSPYPLTDTSGTTLLPSPREGEEVGYAAEDLDAAVDVLQLLPDPWTQGKLNATKLAPKLLKVMAQQGWPGIATVDRALLTRQLTKNPHKITNPYRLLAGDRIPNLPRYAVVAAAKPQSAGATSDEMCHKHPQYRAGARCVPCVMA